MFRSIDKNGDGLITQDEAAGRREKTFEQLAGKGAQALTMEKFSLQPQPKQAKASDDSHMGFQDLRYVALQTRRKQVFKSMDQNGDGKVTKEEFMAAGKKRFETNDLDKDGHLTAWEFDKQHQRF